MKKIVLISLGLTLNVLLAAAQQKVKDGTVTSGNLPNKDAILELESSNKGLLHTRVALRLTTDAFPLRAHVGGMMVYNTATANDVIPGIYYNDGSKWVLAKGGGMASIVVQNKPGTTGAPGLPDSPGGPASGTTIVTNDSGAWLYNSVTNMWTNIGGAGAKGDAGVAGAIGLQGPIGLTGATGAAGANGVGGVTTAGTNITISGTGTAADAYVVNAVIPATTNTLASTGNTITSNVNGISANN